MRAEFIFEKLNFEQNPYDPLRSLGIGHKKTRKELEDIYKQVIDLTKGKPVRRKFADEIMDCLPKGQGLHCGWGNAWKIFDELSDEELDQFDRVITKYYNMLKESVHFEREGHPLDKLKIGRRLLIPELKRKYKETVNAVQMPKNVDLQQGFGNELQKFKPERYITNHGWANLDDIVHELTREEYFEFEQIVLKYWNQLKDPFNKEKPNQHDYIITEQ